ncbi:hypothetical protein N9140_00820, partial [bacterium]|nr:hypothetical protein [bacterium]
ILKDDLNQVTFEAEAFLIPLLNTSEVSLHKPLQNQKRTICLEPHEIERGIWLSPTAVLGYDG